MSTKIIMDCDPGTDDAFSIAMAVASDELDIFGVTTTYGNVGLDHTTNNTLRILDWLGSNIPVYQGIDRALLGTLVDASEYHGATGLEAPEIGQPTSTPREKDAVSFLIDTLRSSSSKVTIVASGPLTNLAVMLRLAPDVVSKIERIVFMGGSTDYGNDSPAAEFNMLCDPHAAQIVFDADVPKTMFGLNVTHQVIATPQRVQAMRDLGNDAGRVFADMSVFFEKVYRERYDFDGSALHDPCTVAWLLRPDLFETRKMRVDVETNSGLSFGRTVHDIWNIAEKGCHTDVALSADADGFFELLTNLLSKLR
ncbi:nucleoside hydrolase [Roseibium sediminicola]|uniref:Nucleoside hydrolase n=1 Tax=Roseibium sediminicola TaxID=2933272 RepID=A0ABT0H2P3_9HYPH|nr:nucleoside hydrolase [Roseibium sp. CAU 1639]MCK7615951.1 nucleoside hydrolase [Roseibium sp. CAU 1639]